MSHPTRFLTGDKPATIIINEYLIKGMTNSTPTNACHISGGGAQAAFGV
jgi:hypothetical protein